VSAFKSMHQNKTVIYAGIYLEYTSACLLHDANTPYIFKCNPMILYHTIVWSVALFILSVYLSYNT